jgi:cysteine desulfurase
LLSLSGISLGASKGVGALYFKDNLRLMPLFHGGIQESGRRGGTENVPGIDGLGKASELAAEELTEKMNHLRELRGRLATCIYEQMSVVLPVNNACVS